MDSKTSLRNTVITKKVYYHLVKSSGTEKYIIHTKMAGYLLLEMIDNDTISQRCGHESISKAMNYPLVPISDATDKMSTFQSEGPPLQHL